MKRLIGANDRSRALGSGLVVAALLHVPSTNTQVTETADTRQVRIERMEIDIWPEYDDPRVLVMYQGAIDSTVPVPTPFAFVIPRGAQIHMAGALGDRGEHLHALFETNPLGDDLTEVTYELEKPQFYMEFYYDPFTGDDARRLRYRLEAPYETAKLMVRVQEPLRAENFRTMPIPVDIVSDAQGFNYHRFSYDNVGPDEARSISVSYLKADRAPSVRPAGEDSPTGGTAMRNVLIISAILLIGVVGYGALRRRTRAGRRSGANIHPDRAVRLPEQQVPGTEPGRSKYCTACGTQLNRGDRFCGFCGTPARGLETLSTTRNAG